MRKAHFSTLKQRCIGTQPCPSSPGRPRLPTRTVASRNVKLRRRAVGPVSENAHRPLGQRWQRERPSTSKCVGGCISFWGQRLAWMKGPRWGQLRGQLTHRPAPLRPSELRTQAARVERGGGMAPCERKHRTGKEEAGSGDGPTVDKDGGLFRRRGQPGPCGDGAQGLG